MVDGGDQSFTDAVIELDVEVINNDQDGFSNGVFSLPSGGAAEYNLDFQFSQRFAEYNNEIGLFVADDSSGRLDGLQPDDDGYEAAALAHPSQQVIFQSGEGAGAENQIRLSAGQHVVFYLVQNGTTQESLQSNLENDLLQNPHVFFSTTAANPDGFDHLREVRTGENSWQLGWEDLLNGGDMSFTDAVINLSLSETNFGEIDQLAQELSENLGLMPTFIDFFDWGGREEKWIQGNDAWYFITPDGGFFVWDGNTPSDTIPLSGGLLAQLDNRYYEDLDLFNDSIARMFQPEIVLPGEFSNDAAIG